MSTKVEQQSGQRDFISEVTAYRKERDAAGKARKDKREKLLGRFATEAKAQAVAAPEAPAKKEQLKIKVSNGAQATLRASHRNISDSKPEKAPDWRSEPLNRDRR